MIALTTLTESDNGREVCYKSHGALEYGRITSWNDYYVFVRYHTKVYTEEKTIGGSPRMEHFTGETSQATSPVSLDFTKGETK